MQAKELIIILHRWSGVRYIITGGILAILDIAVFFWCVTVFEISIEISQIIARTAGAITGFAGHKYYSFGQARTVGSAGRVLTEGVSYLLVFLVALIVSPFLVSAAIVAVGGGLLLGKVLADVFLIFGTFFLTKLVFKNGWRD